MAKNFASIYSGGNDSSALNQSFFMKAETTRGVLNAPAGTDFLYTLSGGSAKFAQAKNSSPHRSGRHNNNIIKEKKTTEWSFSTFINIKTTNPYGTSVDAAVKLLWLSLLGKFTDTGSALQYDPGIDPATTFTIIENLDHLGKQVSGAFVDQCEASLPGDGQAQLNWSGRGKDVKHAGIARSIADNNAGNTFECETPDEAGRFDVGSLVMIVEANGTTRSADTPTGTPRTVTARDLITGLVTLSGAPLADADGSGVGAPIYLCYYEPTGATGIDEPQTGLVGSVTIDTLPTLSCVRSATLTMNNNHELVDYCFGSDVPQGAIFVPGGRLEVTLAMELNLNAGLVDWLNKIRQFEAHAINLICGDSGGRHFKAILPRVIFDIPEITPPESGSVPVSFTGLALQSVLDAGDEVAIQYK